ncbi:MAG: hypothetical protein LBQ49_02635 [Rickettsiales bacterium]|jgi:hypothetical protein|nr:hypothetical protein [Rickettsiales bacterium]
MKKVLAFLSILTIPALAHAAGDPGDISSRFNAAREAARASCVGISEKINQVKIMAGISLAGGGVGLIGGGVGGVAGVMKVEQDDKVKSLGGRIDAFGEKMAEAEGLIPVYENMSAEGRSVAGFDRFLALYDEIGGGAEKYRKAGEGRDEAVKKSGAFGKARTVGSFVGGAGGAAGAVTSFLGTKTIDELIVDMNACDSYRVEIENQRMEMIFADSANPDMDVMTKIVEGCKGMNPRNIAEIKKQMTTAGVISAVGAAAGIAGGVISMSANTKDAKDGSHKSMNVGATVLAGASGVAGLGAMIFSASALSGFSRNAQIAEKCAAAFQ